MGEVSKWFQNSRGRTDSTPPHSWDRMLLWRSKDELWSWQSVPRALGNGNGGLFLAKHYLPRQGNVVGFDLIDFAVRMWTDMFWFQDCRESQERQNWHGPNFTLVRISAYKCVYDGTVKIAGINTGNVWVLFPLRCTPMLSQTGKTLACSAKRQISILCVSLRINCHSKYSNVFTWLMLNGPQWPNDGFSMLKIVETVEVITLHASHSQSNILTATPYTSLCVDKDISIINDPFCPELPFPRVPCSSRCSERKRTGSLRMSLQN